MFAMVVFPGAYVFGPYDNHGNNDDYMCIPLLLYTGAGPVQWSR